MALDDLNGIANVSFAVKETLSWGTSTDWDNARSQDGVEHISDPAIIKLRGWDSFEDTDFSEWTNHQGTQFDQTTADPQDGSAHAVFEGQANWPLNLERQDFVLPSGATLYARMPVACDVNSNSGSDMRGGIAFGIQDSDNFYFSSVRENFSADHEIERIDGGGSGASGLISLSDSGLDDGVWRIHEVIYDNGSGDCTFTVYDASGNQIDSGSTTLSTYENQDTTVGITAYRAVDHYVDAFEMNHSTAGHLEAPIKQFGATMDVSSLELQNVAATLNGESIDVVVQSDTDADGTIEETSDPITLDGSGGPYSVTGLTTNSQDFALRIEPSRAAGNEQSIPQFSEADLAGSKA